MPKNKQITLWGFVIGFSIILGIVVSVFVIEDRIEKRISDKLRDPEVLKEIASLVRPSLIFDHKGSIRTDSGAGQFIERIKVEMGKNEPSNILISPKRHLNIPPVLECLNYNFDVTAMQINKSDWLFELSSPTYIVFESSPKKKEWLFRLEIIR